jgi:hypothetical protein
MFDVHSFEGCTLLKRAEVATMGGVALQMLRSLGRRCEQVLALKVWNLQARNPQTLSDQVTELLMKLASLSRLMAIGQLAGWHPNPSAEVQLSLVTLQLIQYGQNCQ